MKFITRIGTAAAVSAMLLALTGCRSSKPEVNPYTGLMSSRGNVPPAYAEFAPIPRTSGVTPVAPATAPEFEGIGGENAFVAPGPELENAEAPAEDAPAAPAAKSTGRVLPEVPGDGAVPTLASEKTSGETYVVKGGDTLSKIAVAYGVKTADLLAANPKVKSADKIMVGQKLALPAGAKKGAAVATSSAKSSKAPAAKSSSIAKESIPADGKYAVRSGDSLWVIARRFGLKSDDIRRWNDLSTDKLQVGQELKLTGSAAAPQSVAPAAAPAPALDDVPVVPGVEAPAAPAAEVTPAAVPATDANKTYPGVVMPGDTLESIASFSNTTVEKLRELNPQIQSDADLKPDMQILLPYSEE